MYIYIYKILNIEQKLLHLSYTSVIPRLYKYKFKSIFSKKVFKISDLKFQAAMVSVICILV